MSTLHSTSGNLKCQQYTTQTLFNDADIYGSLMSANACHRLGTRSRGFKTVQTKFVCWAFNSSPFVKIHLDSIQLLKLMLK